MLHSNPEQNLRFPTPEQLRIYNETVISTVKDMVTNAGGEIAISPDDGNGDVASLIQETVQEQSGFVCVPRNAILNAFTELTVGGELATTSAAYADPKLSSGRRIVRVRLTETDAGKP